jgi:hypothetical protein
MASLDSLPADQKAVLSLVLQRGRTFDEIAALLSIDRAAVRQRALEGFDALGPDTTLEPLKRALITDYLLGQLPAGVATSVRDSLAASPPERAWARVIAAEIGPLSTRGLPEIPAAGTARPGPAGTGVAAATSSPGAPQPEAELEPASASETPVAHAGSAVGAAPAAAGGEAGGPRSSRRGGAILLGLIALVVVVVVIILLVTGGSGKKKSPSAQVTTTPPAASTSTPASTPSTGAGTSTKPTALHQINLASPRSVKGREGAADVVRASGKLGVVLVAEGLPANTKNAYGVWLFNSMTGGGKFLGFYSQKVTGTGKAKGELEAEVALPSGATQYNELLLTLETAEKPTKPGKIVLEGTFAE